MIVRVTTYKPGTNQGEVVKLGVVDMDVTVETVTITVKNGCCSPEIVSEECHTTTILGRKFIVDAPTDEETAHVFIPSELAEQLKVTATLGELSSDNVTYLEMARVAMEMVADELCEELDIADEEFLRLRDKLELVQGLEKINIPA